MTCGWPKLGNEEEGMFWPAEVMIPNTALLLHSFHIHIPSVRVCARVFFRVLYERAWDQGKRPKGCISVFESMCVCGPSPTVCNRPHIPLVFHVNVLQAWNNDSSSKPSSHGHVGTQWRSRHPLTEPLCASLCVNMCVWELMCYRLWLNTAQFHTHYCIHWHRNRSSWKNITEFPIYHLRWSILRPVKCGRRGIYFQ